LLLGTGLGGHAEGDVLSNFERLDGSDFNDDLTGDNLANVLVGKEGDDSLMGLDGDDLLEGNNGNDFLVGGAGADTLEGADGNDVLRGGEGADVMNGGAGDDAFQTNITDDVTGDVFNGGTAVTGDLLITFGGAAGGAIDFRNSTITDIEQFRLAANFTGDVEASFNADQFNFSSVVAEGHAGFTSRLSIDLEDATTLDLSTIAFSGFVEDGDGVTITGDADGETITGSSINDIISDGDGADTINAGAGNDIFRADTANQDFLAQGDSIDGGTGTDTFELLGGRAGNTVFDMAAGTFTNQGFTNSVKNFENFDASTLTGTESYIVLGTDDDNIISTGNGNDNLEGRAGADTLDGGAGFDLVTYASSDAGVTVSLLSGTGTGGHAQGDILSNFERLDGSDLDDVLTGDNLANVLVGKDGNDTLNGLGGDDLLEGNAGNDILNGGAGNDTLEGADGNDVLIGGDGADIMNGGAGDDGFQVDITNDVTGDVFNGGTAVTGDLLIAFGGAAGGAIDFRSSTITDVEQFRLAAIFTGDTEATFNADQMNFSSVVAEGHAGLTARLDIVMDTATTLDLSAISFSGFNQAGDGVTISGDGDSEDITGSSIDDIINTGGGVDSINAGLGNDVVNAGGGNDFLKFETGSTAYGGTYDGDAGDDILLVVGDDGIADIRDVSFSGLAQIQYFATAGDARTVQASAAEFNTGGFSAAGFLIDGNEFSDSRDLLHIFMEGETSLDLTHLSFTDWREGDLNQDDLVEVFGDSDNEIITGSSQRDRIFGGDGDDTLDGHTGNDILIGGIGDDTLDMPLAIRWLALKALLDQIVLLICSRALPVIMCSSVMAAMTR